MNGNRLLVCETRTKVFAFEHSRKAVVGAKLHNFRTGKFVEPFAVVADFGFAFVEDFENLVQIRFRIGIDFGAGKRRTRFRAAGGIANHRREIADEKYGGVAHVLKMLQLAQHHGVAKMNVRSGGIDAEINAQGNAGLERFFEARFQFVFANNFRDTFFQVGELFGDGLEGCRHCL